MIYNARTEVNHKIWVSNLMWLFLGVMGEISQTILNWALKMHVYDTWALSFNLTITSGWLKNANGLSTVIMLNTKSFHFNSTYQTNEQAMTKLVSYYGTNISKNTQKENKKHTGAGSSLTILLVTCQYTTGDRPLSFFLAPLPPWTPTPHVHEVDGSKVMAPSVTLPHSIHISFDTPPPLASPPPQ